MGGHGGGDGHYSKYTQQVSFREPGRTDGRTDNVKTVYPPTNTVCGGYNDREKDRQGESSIAQLLVAIIIHA